MIGLTVGTLYLLTILVLKLWTMISFKGYLPEQVYEEWFYGRMDTLETGIMIAWTSLLVLSLLITVYSIIIITKTAKSVSYVKVASGAMALHIVLLVLLTFSSLSTTIYQVYNGNQDYEAYDRALNYIVDMAAELLICAICFK